MRPTFRFGRFARTLGAFVVVGTLVEIASHLTIVAANPFLTQPILTRRALFEGQSRLLGVLLDSARRDQLDPTLGWTYRPGYAAGPDTLNREGMRSSREYSPSPSDSLPRIAAFGNSFVYCTEVSNDECWSSQLEAGWRVEALNYGVGGYGTDQSFLRYLADGREYEPSTVLVGFAPVNLRRTVNRYRRFLSPLEGPWFKPRFRIVGDELRLIPSPIETAADARLLLDDPERVIRFGVSDYWYEPAIYEHRLYRLSATYRLFANVWIRLQRRYFDDDRFYADGLFRTESEAFELQLRLMTEFADSITAAGATPVFLFLPTMEDVSRWSRGEPPVYAPLWWQLEAEGFSLVDPIQALADAAPHSKLFAPGGHYSAEGNRILAEVLARALDLSAR